MLDCEIDYCIIRSGIRPPQDTVTNLAAGACMTWWLSAKPARRDTIRKAFQERQRFVPGNYGEFRNAWIAKFRELECSEPSEPEGFFE